MGGQWVRNVRGGSGSVSRQMALCPVNEVCVRERLSCVLICVTTIIV
jgi:hypothetical protein